MPGRALVPPSLAYGDERMIGFDEVHALGEYRFAMRMQVISQLIRDMGAVPEGFELQVQELRDMAENVKANAFAAVNEKYRITEREQ